MGAYSLKCLHPQCGRLYPADSAYRLRCDDEISGAHGPALLRPVYAARQISVRLDQPGIFPYTDWLPCGGPLPGPQPAELGAPCCYASTGLAARLRLRRLYIAFSGWWPERGARLLTRTFKEFEAQATLARLRDGPTRAPLLVASAGNTANGFNLLCHQTGTPLVLVVPECGLANLTLPFETRPLLIAVRGDYTDAIELANALAGPTGLTAEGGARNVVRRAGMSTVMLHAVAHPQHGTGELFDHYVQAIGSGTGAIAAWEAVLLLLEDGRFGRTRTRIHVAQNSPFTPVPDAWDRRRRELRAMPDAEARRRIAAVADPVLTNRQPAYSLHGGLFDVLTASGGSTRRVSNSQVEQAARFFTETEGIPIAPAAAVAVAALGQAVESGSIRPNDRVLLHITGGGLSTADAGSVHRVQPAVTVNAGEFAAAVEAVRSFCGTTRWAPGASFW